MRTHVAPLSGAEPLYLMAVKPPHQRCNEFSNNDKWKWVMQLTLGDKVTFMWRKVAVNGTIQSLGNLLEDRPGVHFGVEITVSGVQ